MSVDMQLRRLLMRPGRKVWLGNDSIHAVKPGSSVLLAGNVAAATSICSVQDIAAKWPQPLPRAQSVKQLAIIHYTSLCLQGFPNTEFTEQKWLILPFWSLVLQQLEVLKLYIKITIILAILSHVWPGILGSWNTTRSSPVRGCTIQGGELRYSDSSPKKP